MMVTQIRISHISWGSLILIEWVMTHSTSHDSFNESWLIQWVMVTHTHSMSNVYLTYHDGDFLSRDKNHVWLHSHHHSSIHVRRDSFTSDMIRKWLIRTCVTWMSHTSDSYVTQYSFIRDKNHLWHYSCIYAYVLYTYYKYVYIHI